MVMPTLSTNKVGNDLINLVIAACVKKNLVSDDIADFFHSNFKNLRNFEELQNSISSLPPKKTEELSILIGLATLATTAMQNFEAAQNWVSIKDRFKEYIVEKLSSSDNPQQTLQDLKKAKSEFLISITFTAHPDLFYPKAAILFEGELSKQLQALAEQNNPNVETLESLIDNFALRIAERDATLSHLTKVRVVTEVEIEERNSKKIEQHFEAAFAAWNEAVDELCEPQTKFARGRISGLTSSVPKSITNLKGLEDLRLSDNEKHLSLLTWNRSADADGRLLATREALRDAANAAIVDGKYTQPKLDLRDNSEIHSLFMNALCQALYRANPDVGANGKTINFRQLCEEFGRRHGLKGMGDYIYDQLTSEQKIDFMQMVVQSGALLLSDFKEDEHGRIILDIRSNDGTSKGHYVDFIHKPIEGNEKPLVRSIDGEKRALTRDETDKLSEVFKRLSEVRKFRERGIDLVNRHEIANFEKPEHFLEMLVLLIETGHIEMEKGHISKVHFGPMPLFETHEDFNNSEKILDQMFSNPIIREYFIVHGKVELMAGFSDGAKSCGNFASRWEIYKYEEAARRMADKHFGKEFPIDFKYGMGNGAYRGSTLEAGVYTMQHPLSSIARNRHDQTWQSVQVTRIANHEILGRNHVASTIIGTIDGFMRAITASRKPLEQLDIDFSNATRSANDLIAKVAAEVYEQKIYTHPEIDKFVDAIPGNGNASSRSQARAATSKTGVMAMRAVPYEYKALVADIDLLDVGLKEGLEALERNPKLIANLVEIHAQIYPKRAELSDKKKAYEIMMLDPFFSSQMRVSEQSLRQTNNLEIGEKFAQASGATGLFANVRKSLDGAAEKISGIVRGVDLNPRISHSARANFFENAKNALKQMGQALVQRGISDSSMSDETRNDSHMAVATLCATVKAAPRAEFLNQAQAAIR